METEGTPRRHLFPIDRTQPAYLSTTLNPTTDEIPQKNFWLISYPICLSRLSQCIEEKRGRVSMSECLSVGPPPSQGSLLSGEESTLLFLSPPQSVDPPAHGCHDQHHKAGTQQSHWHHFGLEQSVECKSDSGAGHANDQRYDAEREHAAVPRLLCTACSLCQSFQGGEGFWMFGRVPSGISYFSVQPLVLVLRVQG